MLKAYFPYEYAESVFTIDYQKLYKMGYKAILFDIDNTLTHHGEDSTPEIDALFQTIHSIGFKTLLLSNNNKARIERFIQNIDTLYIEEADKPRTAGFLKAIELLKIEKSEAIYIGDQIFSDIYGANKSGIANILVRYLRYPDEKKIGIKRNLEKIILMLYRFAKKYQHRLGEIEIGREAAKMPAKRKKLFCEISPTCYKISLQKEICKRHIKNLFSGKKYAKVKNEMLLSHLVFEHHSNMIKRAPGVDLIHQLNKAVNIDLACKKIDKLLIRPGETFSFWKTVGKTTKKKGYKEGRIIKKNQLVAGIGGGLCNLGNTIHLLVLHSPLKVTEFHKHSDALAPDAGKRVPMSAGTSVSYNNLDFQFFNNTDQILQLHLWCEGEELHAELRSEQAFPHTYQITEEDHHFSKEGEKFYRISKIYRETTCRADGALIKKELIWDNHSEVMFDYSLIPEDQTR